MNKKGLRFGVIFNCNDVENWQIHCVKKMLEIKYVDAGLVITVDNTPSKSKKDSDARLGEWLTEIPTIEVQGGSDACQLSKSEKECINVQKLDFVINFSMKRIEEEIANLLPYGVWTFQHNSDSEGYRWEIVNEETVTFAGLFKLTQKNEQIPLKQGCFSIIKDSFKKNKKHITSVISGWPALVCRDILNNNADYLNQLSKFASIPNRGKSTLVQRRKYIGKLFKNKYKLLFSKLFSYEYWNVGIVNKPIHEFLNDSNAEINWLIEKKDLYYADPFAYQDKDGLRILMEELDYRVVKGYISSVSVTPNCGLDIGTFDQAMMKLPCHMSYPFILEHNNHIYCIPETSEAKEAAIYKLNKASKQWEKIKALLNDFPAVDSTIVHYEGYWWLFCTRSFSTVQSHNNELHIFYADDLLGEWKSHSLNPVKFDIRSSRPAGTPFIHQGALYRPAQDCSKTYGGRIVLNRINLLTTTQFGEEPICLIEPKSESLYPDGVHTVSSAGGITIIDGKRFDYSFLHFFRKLYKYKRVKNLQKQPRATSVKKNTKKNFFFVK
jgi:hypothetical protein